MQLSNVSLKYVCDENQDRLKNLAKYAKVLKLVKNPDEVISDEKLDAVAIVTPASTHYQLVKMALKSKKHVIVEKPFTMSYAQSIELSKLSEKYGKILMVGHIYCFNPAVQYIKQLIRNNELGTIYYGLGLRLGLGPIRSDADCVWDLATHDISMLDYIFGRIPRYVSAHALAFIQKERKIYDYASIQLIYDDFRFSVSASWYAPEKIRTWYLIGSNKMLKFDDLNKSNPLTIYSESVTVSNNNSMQHRYIPKEGDITLPYISQEEPLLLELQHFVNAISSGEKVVSNAQQGARVVKVLEAITKSINNSGQFVEINSNDNEQ